MRKKYARKSSASLNGELTASIYSAVKHKAGQEVFSCPSLFGYPSGNFNADAGCAAAAESGRKAASRQRDFCIWRLGNSAVRAKGFPPYGNGLTKIGEVANGNESILD